MVSYFMALFFALQQPAAPAPPRRAPAAPAPATLEVRVTDRSGTPVTGAHVVAEGPSRREGTTGPDGSVTFRTMSTGTYRLRAEAELFIPFEKEVGVKSGVPAV